MNTMFRIVKRNARISYRLTLAAAGVLLALPSLAAPEHYGAGARRDQGNVIVIKSGDCRMLQKHVPAADVAYQPGVTKSGKKVASADLAPAPDFGRVDDLKFTFNIRLNKAVGSGAVGASYGDVLGEAPIGTVEMKNGVLSFNGVPLDEAQTLAISEGCKTARAHEDQKKK